MNNTKWTKSEDDIIIENYELGGVKECGKKLNRSNASIYKRAILLKVRYGGLNHNHKDLNGIKFGFLIVKEISHRNRQVYWKCQCKCGKETIVRSDVLIRGDTISCGCYADELHWKTHYKGGRYITGQEFTNIKKGAENRNINFNITIKDIEEIYEKQNKKCNLSGIDIKFNTTHTDGGGKILRGNASIDRIDSSKDYSKNNIQIVDKNINLAKRSLSQEEFILMCKRVTKYNE